MSAILNKFNCIIMYCIYPKYWDTQPIANSSDPNKMPYTDIADAECGVYTVCHSAGFRYNW